MTPEVIDLENLEGFTESELAEFLHEIETTDELLQEATEKAESSIHEIKQIEEVEDAENEAHPAQKEHVLEKAWRASREKFSAIRARKTEIQRKALAQSNVRLTDTLDPALLRRLICLLTSEYTSLINKYSEFINRRLTIILWSMTPRLVRNCYRRFPISMKTHPGFMYIANHYSEGYTFWATPDIPYYFEQGTEMQELIAQKPQFLRSIDVAVQRYTTYQKELREKEIKYAAKLRGLKHNTYFDLLKLNPFWFETLYNDLYGDL